MVALTFPSSGRRVWNTDHGQVGLVQDLSRSCLQPAVAHREVEHQAVGERQSRGYAVAPWVQQGDVALVHLAAGI